MKSIPRPHRRPGAFTLVELLTVIAIIAILAGLVLSTSGYIQKKAARSRAEAEIAAMEAALESYRADNGAYPEATVVKAVYQALTGDGNDTIGGSEESDGTWGSQGKVYMEFKPSQINSWASGDSKPSAPFQVIDPWGNAYGFRAPGEENPATFDLWSTAGTTSGTDPTADDITNW